MAIKQRDARDEQPTCEECLNRKNAARRHLHYLRFADESALAGHLKSQLGEKAESDGTISAIVSWVHSTRERYSDFADEHGARLPVWRAWAMANRRATLSPSQAPRTEVGRLFAAKVWDSLASAYKQPITVSLRDEFLAELNTGEIEAQEETGPLAEELSALSVRS